MRVTLINMRISNSVFMPLGIMYLASVLEKAGFRVQIIDPFSYETDREILSSIESFEPKYVGFSVMTPTFAKTKRFIAKLKEVMPDKIYFAGGVHATVLPENNIRELGLDLAVIGEAEFTLWEALMALENKTGLDKIKGIAYRGPQAKIKNNGPAELITDLDRLAFPSRHLLDIEKYFVPPGYIRSFFLDRVANVITGRGCPMQCIFCCSNVLYSSRVRRRSVENVLAEIDYLIEKYNINGIYFSDETFSVDYKWVFRLCDEIKKRRLPWGCATRIDLLNEEVISRMKDARCIQVDLGVESGSDRILKVLKKNTTNAEIKRTFAMLNKHKMRTFATLMVGSPGETREDIMQTKELLKEIRPNFTHISWFTPFPGTEAYRLLENSEEIKSGNMITDFDFVVSDKPAVNLTKMNFQELVSSRSILQRAVFLKNYLSVIKPHNMKYILEAVFYALLVPHKLFKALSTALVRHSFDYFFYFVFFNYQIFKMKLKKAT